MKRKPVQTWPGAEASSDPRKVLDYNFKAKVNVGGYERTLIDKSGVVPPPPINNDINPDTRDDPNQKQRLIDIFNSIQ